MLYNKYNIMERNGGDIWPMPVDLVISLRNAGLL
jgi:hypothetical protein